MIDPKDIKEFAAEIKSQFSDLIADGLEFLGQTENWEHEIRPSNDEPNKQPMRGVLYAAREEFKRLLEDMLKSNVSESESLWSS